ncbi:DUF1127 domain-containing protein [Roseibium sp.]|uniref:DUF1127 domain-containing protein n=1 Tax=Roseibium sp. TaxID=1936156 RepID=UPI003A9731A7
MKKFRANVAAWIRERKAQESLNRLDDRTLKDIGLSRVDVLCLQNARKRRFGPGPL